MEIKLKEGTSNSQFEKEISFFAKDGGDFLNCFYDELDLDFEKKLWSFGKKTTCIGLKPAYEFVNAQDELDFDNFMEKVFFVDAQDQLDFDNFKETKNEK